MMNITELSEIVQSCRKESGLSQVALAELAGVGKTVIFDIEKGKITIQLDTLLKILAVLNIQIMLEPPFSINTRDKL